MPSSIKLVAFSGSARKDSYNSKLVKIAAAGASDAGATVAVHDFREYPLPLFDQDCETVEGMPENAKLFKKLLRESDGFLIASPEYNSSLSGLLKNAIDWASRVEDGEAPLSAFDGKVAGLLSASPGGLGGLRGLSHLRSILSSMRVIVIPTQHAVSAAANAFKENGLLIDPKQDARVRQVGEEVANFAAKLKG